MSIGFSEEELLTGYANWLKWLKQKRNELETKQAKLERRMGSNATEKGEGLEVDQTHEIPPISPEIPTEAEVPETTPAVGEGSPEMDDWL